MRAVWTARDDEQLDLALQIDPTLTSHALAELLRSSQGRPRFTPVQVARHLRERERVRTDSHPKRDLVVPVPESPKPHLSNPIRLEGNPNRVILSDLHVPYHDARWLNQVLTLARAWGIETCVLQGDTVDGTCFSKFGHAPDDTLEEELSAGEGVLASLAASFGRVVVMLGNHETNRLLKTLQQQLRAERFLRMLTDGDNVEITHFEWIEATPRETDGYGWVHCHPRNSSVIAGRVPSLIASRSWPRHHVSAGHGHLVGLVRADDGVRWCVDTGICADTARLAYSTFSISTRPAMAQGALLIYEGRPWLVTPDMDLTALARVYA